MVSLLPKGKVLFSLLILLVACGESQQRVSDPDLAEELRNRELRHITPGQITQATMTAGQQVTKTIQTALIQKLTDAIPEEGLVEAAKYCQPALLPAADSLSKVRNMAIHRYRLTGPLSKGTLTDKEYQVLDAYRYSAENNLPMDPNVQGEKDRIFYNAPVIISDQVCLKCHGKIGQDLTKEDYLALSARYRLDSLVNYSNGQALATWLLQFSRKGIVQTIE